MSVINEIHFSRTCLKTAALVLKEQMNLSVNLDTELDMIQYFLLLKMSDFFGVVAFNTFLCK